MPNWRFSGGKNRPRPGTAAAAPLIKISPPSGSSNPAAKRRVVVLPQPEGPSRVKISPGKIEKLTPSTALTVWNRFKTPRNSRTAGAMNVW